MQRYLVDANLPYYFSLWKGQEYLHQADLGRDWSDSRIWEYAESQNLTIITKDADFSNRIILSEPPPRVIHIKTGNMKLSEFHGFLSSQWEEILTLSVNHKLVNVYNDELFAIR